MTIPAASRPVIADIRIEDLPAVRAFMDRAYKPDDVTCLDDYFRWQFRRCGDEQGVSGDRTLMAVVGGRVVGICLVPEYDVAMSGQIVRGGWIHHWFTEPGHGPIGLAMLKRLLGGLRFFGGAGISSQGVAAMRLACPALVVFDLVRLYAVFDADATFDLVFDRGPGTRTYLRSLRLPASRSARVDRVEAFDDRYECVWDAVRTNFLFATHRTAKYMNWRYFAHPYFTYKAVCCCGIQGEVYYVWREERIHGRDRVVVRLCDVIGPLAAIEETFASAYDAMSESKPLFVDFYCSNADVVSGLVAGGMQPAVTRSDFDLPRLFQPLERDSMKTLHFYYQVSPLDVPGHTAFTRSYITKSDSNQDRPNLIT